MHGNTLIIDRAELPLWNVNCYDCIGGMNQYYLHIQTGDTTSVTLLNHNTLLIYFLRKTQDLEETIPHGSVQMYYGYRVTILNRPSFLAMYVYIYIRLSMIFSWRVTLILIR